MAQTGCMNRTSNHRRSHAFTLVELLVGVAIIGMLMSLLLPAVQSAREAARRIQCQNNLRQTGLTLLNFESVYRVFPASGWTKPGPCNPTGSYLSWRTSTLPFVEQSNITTQYDTIKNWWDAQNLAVGQYAVPTFLCPSTPIQPRVTNVSAKPPRPALILATGIAATDYEAIMGVRPQIDPSTYDAQNRFSVMHRDSRTKFAQITDGSSNTIMVSETAARPAVFRRGKARTELANDQGISWIDSESAYTLDGASADGSLEGCGIAAGCTSAMNARNDNEPYSFHLGGIQALFADGHIAFESESVALSIFAAKITRAAAD